jgi:hypothetical protein
MSAHDLITLAELKAYRDFAGPDRDTALALEVSAASGMIEDEVGRRLVYRGPAEVAGAGNILGSTAFDNGSSGAFDAQPVAARTAIVTFDPTITAGTLTLTGTVEGVAGVTEVFNVADGLLQHGIKPFTALSLRTIANKAGAGNFKIGSSVGYIEHHTVDPSDPCALRPLEWRVRYVIEANEDPSLAFGASTKLVAGTGFQLIGEDVQRQGASTLLRLTSSLPTAWAGGWRASRLTLVSGWRIAEVHSKVKDVCAKLTLLLFDELAPGRIGVSGRSDDHGNYTRFGPSRLTHEMRAILAPYRRRRFGLETGERDVDLDAA